MNASRAYRVYLILQGASALLRTTIYTVLAVYYVQTVHMNPLQLVLVGTVLEITCFLFEVPTGVVADTYSRRLSVIIGQFLVGLCFILEGLVPLFAAILLAEVIRGIGETFLSGALEAWLADEVGEENAGRAFLRGAQASQIGSFVGIFASVGLASLRLDLPVVLGGTLLLGLGIYLLIAMPEQGFRPTPRGERTSLQAMGSTFRHGVRIVRQRPLVLTILAVGLVFGASSEGLDRLWEAHFLTDLHLPALGALKPVVWFGIISAVGMLLGLAATEVANRRLDMNRHAVVVRALQVISGFMSVSVIAFALAGNFWLALAASWATGVLRTLYEPLYQAWLNQNVDSSVRATVFSVSGQANALGQLVVGPGIGAIGAVFGLRAAIAVAGLLLSPTLLLYRRVLGGVAAEASEPVPKS